MKQESEHIVSAETNAHRAPFAGLSPGEGQEFIGSFHRPTFSVRESGITAKRFHDWHHAGLLPFGMPEGRKNLLTFPEFLWVRLIDRLRGLGYPLGSIRSLKEYLFSETNLGTMSQETVDEETRKNRMPLLHVLLAHQLANPGEMGVALYPSGELRLWMEAMGEPRPNGTHLYLSLSEEVRAFRGNKAIEVKVRDLGLPVPGESRVTGDEGMYGQQTGRGQ